MSRTVCITGASNGIGRALAYEYAAPGVGLALLGRDAPRLEETAAECRRRGADVRTATLDVRDCDTLERWLAALDDETPIDVLIANAGVSSGVARDGSLEPSATSLRVVDVNLRGAIATVGAIAERMRRRRRGRIVLISSIASLLPQPALPSYGASKAGLTSYGLALASALRRYGVIVSVACPGYVDTDMSRRHHAFKPFQWSVEKAAGHIRRRSERGDRTIVFPKPLAFGARLLALMPTFVFDLIIPAFAADVAPDREAEAERRQTPTRKDNGPS